MELEYGGIRARQRMEAISAVTKAGEDFEWPPALVGKLGNTMPAGITLNLDVNHYSISDCISDRVARLVGSFRVRHPTILDQKPKNGLCKRCVLPNKREILSESGGLIGTQ
jgi:hypothetical protein